jgi:DNA-3-methyladenine glycosylase
MATLPLSFFARPTLRVARDLVGSVLTAGVNGVSVRGRIVEVEAYLGRDDPASHAARGPTGRSAIMFGPPGVAYVYFIYGMHHCLNVVTEPEGTAGAILIRALQPLAGLETMTRRRTGSRTAQGCVRRVRSRELCNGPGKLCQALGIDRSWNTLSFLAGQGSGTAQGSGHWLALEAGQSPAPRILETPRIGIRKAAARPYRFTESGSRWLSCPAAVRPCPV